MALPKLFQRIFWKNGSTPAINEDNLNAMSKGLSDIDDRVIQIANVLTGETQAYTATVYIKTLSANATSVTFTDVSATSVSMIQVGTSVPGLDYNTISKSGSSYTVTFDSQSSSVIVYLIVTEVL